MTSLPLIHPRSRRQSSKLSAAENNRTNPDGKVPVIGIPFREIPEDVWLRLRLTAEDMKPFQAACRFSPLGLDFQKIVRVLP